MSALNALRGETTLEADGRAYTLTLDVNAFCYAQPVLNMKPREMVGTFEAEIDDMVVVRALLWAALQKHHACHIVEAGEIMADAGLTATRSALTACLVACFGSAEDGEEQNPPKPKPRKAIRGTG